MLKAILTLVIAAGTGALLWWMIGVWFPATNESTAGGRTPINAKVITQPVRQIEDRRSFEAVGTGKAYLAADIHPAVSEEVVEVLFTAQQKVDKGDVLVKLDNREEQLAVTRAEVQLKDAKSLLQRYEQAVKKGAVPESEVDSARAAFQSAEVAVEQAKLALEQRTITAPFSGVVGIPQINPGDRVTPDTLITGLDARETLFVDFDVPETLTAALAQPSITITATTPAWPGESFHGKIEAQGNRVDVSRRTLQARASLPNEGDKLRPGMSFTLHWAIPGKHYPAVPEIALQWSREGSYLWLIQEGKAVPVPARVVSRVDGYVLVEGEVPEGTAVVVEGMQRLKAGAKVEVMGAAAE